MADRESTFVIQFDGKAGDLTNVLSALKSRVRSDVNELQSIAGKVELFKGTQEAARAASDEFRKLTERAADFRQQIARIEGEGGKVGKELTNSLRATEKAIAAANKEYTKQADTAKKLGVELAKAGVDVAKLADEEARLARAIEQANVAAAKQASKDLLGFKSLKDIAPEIARVREAFDSLRKGGELSFGELSVAAARTRERIAALRGDALGVGQAFANLRGQAIAIAGALTGLALAASQSAKAYRDFSQQVANVQSIAGVSRQRIDQLAEGVRELSRTLGVDAVESTKALYQILSSGIPVDNALAVLEQSTQAAIAGLTQVDTAAKVGVAVLNSYGLQVTELGRVFDVLFTTVRDGVVEFPELAQNIGEVLPVARSAGVALEQVGAAFVVLTRNGINAAETAVSIRSAIQALSAPAPETRQKFRDLNITLGDFQKTLEQIAERNLGPEILRQLVPDVRALRGVQILTQNIGLLRDEIGEMNKAAGATQAAFRILADTPEARVRRFNAAVKDLALSFGEFVTNATSGIQGITNLINSFNALSTGTRRVAIEFAAFVAGVAGFAVVLRTLSAPLNLFIGALFQAVPALARFKLGIDAATLSMRALNLAFAAFVGFEVGTVLRDNITIVREFGDVLGTALAAGAQSAGLALTGLGQLLTGNTAGLRKTREEGQRLTDFMRGEFVEIFSGARGRIVELEQANAKLREEFARASDAAVRAAQGTEAAVSAIATNTRTLAEGVASAIRGVEDSLGTLVAKLGEAVTATQSLAQQSLGNIGAQVQQQIAALNALTTNEVDRVRATVDIQRKAAAERFVVLQKFGQDAVAAFDAEAKARLEIAKRSGQDIARVEVELLNARRGVVQGVLDSYRAHFNQLLQLEAQHVANVKGIQEQRAALNQSVEDRIREARRLTMTDAQKYADRVLQIDKLLSDARQALIRGDNKLAEDLANKALGITDQIAQRVESGGRVIVSAFDASANAVGRYKAAQDVLNKSLEQREQAEREGADAAKTAAKEVEKTIVELTAQVDELARKAGEGIKLRVEKDSEALDALLVELQGLTTEAERLRKINLDVTEAQIELARLRADLEKGVTVNVEARTEKIDAALKRIREAEPTLSINVAPALAELEKVRASAKSLEKVRMQIDSNAAQVQKEIDALKAPTSSTHTIFVKRVEVQGTGGMVGEGAPVARGFARGGAVFRRPGWRKVPGQGDGDTVPAALEAGSYVVRKAASKHYGDGIMRALSGGILPARGYAVGGIAERILRGLAKPTRSASGSPLGSSDESTLGGIIAEAFRVIGPLLSGAGRLKRSNTGQNLEDYLAAVLELIQRAPSVEVAKEYLDMIKAAAKAMLASILTAQRFGVPIVMGATGGGTSITEAPPLAGGGPAGTDTVPAWLTPGEWVVKRSAVAKYGAGLLDAINGMRIPRATLAGMFAPPAVRRFAEGGPVGGSVQTVQSAGSGATSGNTYSINVNAAAGALLSEENVRRFILPVIERIERRAR
jgi:TP901 family phage tail tape measure protein